MKKNDSPDLTAYCSDLERWPQSWEGFPEDRIVGKKILELFKPFIAALINKGLSRKTIRRHIDNLWILGGELIREVNMDDSDTLRSKTARSLITESIGAHGGPYCRHLDTTSEINSFDATCRKLHKFLQSEK